jgi:hypothetical protein
MKPINTAVMIGAGGIGSWAAESLVRICERVVVFDGDRLEEKNLDRQLYTEEDLGKNKAQALAEKHFNIIPRDEWFTSGSEIPDNTDLLFCGADNDGARLSVLSRADYSDTLAVICANGYTDADAYAYLPSLMQNTPADPRKWAPELYQNRGQDPTGPPGCQGEAQKQTPQLVIANMSAAALGLRLAWFWLVERRKKEWWKSTMQYWPVQFVDSATRSWAVLLNERK